MSNTITVSTFDSNARDLFKAALKAPYGVRRLLTDPIGVSGNFGYTVTPGFAQQIKELNVHNAVGVVDDEIDMEVADFFHYVITDGRYVSDAALNPTRVASDLRIEISDDAATRISEISKAITPPELDPRAGGAAVVAIAIAVVIAFGPKKEIGLVLQPDLVDLI